MTSFTLEWLQGTYPNHSPYLPSRPSSELYSTGKEARLTEMEDEDRTRELVGHVMRLISEIGALNDGRPALSPLNLDNLEGTLREVKERNQRLREECERMEASKKERKRAVR